MLGWVTTLAMNGREQVLMRELAEGKALPTGTKRQWIDGEYEKQADGSWKRVSTSVGPKSAAAAPPPKPASAASAPSAPSAPAAPTPKPVPAALTPEQQKELDLVKARRKQNPMVHIGRDGKATLSFKTVNNSSEPLWWTGDGFKDLGRVRGEPEEFGSAADAEAAIKAKLVPFIQKWRDDQQHLVFGW